jgi:hypothetical protein
MTDNASDTSLAQETAGASDYIVQQGECADSIAYEHGHFWKTIWNDPANAKLKNLRRNPNILFTGDQLTIPAIRLKQESCATEQRHCFRRRGVPAMLCLRLLRGNQKPRAGEDYVLDVDGALMHDKTDGQGFIRKAIPPNARHALLLIGRDRFELCLGHVDPIDQVTGIQGRLNNLGFDCGALDGILGPKTMAAISRFQREYELPVTHKPDAATCGKLVDVHGS